MNNCKEIPCGKVINGWISVDDDKPSESQSVIAFGYQGIKMLFYVLHIDSFFDGEFRAQVTHWMPLPEAPTVPWCSDMKCDRTHSNCNHSITDIYETLNGDRSTYRASASCPAMKQKEAPNVT